MGRYHVLQFDNTDAGHLWQAGWKLDYMYEHMASVGSLDVVNLPTMSTETEMSLPRDDCTNQNQKLLGMYVMCYSCTLVYVTFHKVFQPTDQQTDN